MAYLALSHRIQRLVKNVESSQITEMRSRLWHHRGLAIRAVNEEIDGLSANRLDVAITSVMLLLFTEVSLSLQLQLEATSR